MKTNIGDRIKRYESAYNPKLTPKSPLFIRVDGKSFHSYTKHMNRPFDKHLIDGMIVAAQKTAKTMMGFKLAYIQSDEATFMLTDFDRHDMEGWFNYELNKVVSITASTFTAFFLQYMGVEEPAMFDARAFIVPLDDFPNVFVWRQRDWERNSLQMVARHHFSQKELDGKNRAEMHEMLHSVDVNWANLLPVFKNGTFLFEDLKPVHKSLNYEEIYDSIVPSLFKDES